MANIMLTAHYDTLLVLVSLLVAILASYTALDMAGRIHTATDKSARWWLAGGAVAMGIGIWSMHFIGMLAFRLPIALGYDIPITMLSLVIAIAVSAYALGKTSSPTLPLRRLASSALTMGGGISSMHYVGMMAMRMNPVIEYQPRLFALSVVVAIVAAGVALKVTHMLRVSAPNVKLARALAAVLLGSAIVGMHYIGMAAADFPAGSICRAAREGMEPRWMAVLVFVVTVSVLAITLITSVLDARLESRTARLASSLMKANQQLKKQTLHDHLTNLPNRILLEDRLDQAISQASRNQAHFALMFLDLDGFKTINDSLGHHSGDDLLIETAARIRAVVRSEDTVARLGGDEFVVLTQLTQAEDAATIAEKLLEAINRPYLVGEHEIRLSTSIGIATFPEDGSSGHQLMVNADAAMYHVKNGGRNAYCFFKASMNADAQNKLALMQDLRGALEKKQFVLHYQPKLATQTGRISGVEALLRWQHPERGMVGPDTFIPLAERSGLIVAIGEWVINEACRQLKAWHEQGCQGWTIAVNLSAVQFANEGLVEVVENALKAHGLEARFLTLEVTETVAMKDVEQTLALLNRMVALGVAISIDDFGTGYSSLLYLKRFPACELKIDRGFVKNLGAGSDDSAIVSAIIGLGRSLGLNIVAEGVETEAQHAFLATLGCHTMQGYWIARPMPAQDVVRIFNPAHSAATAKPKVESAARPAVTQFV
jgi:diguanylate cyclase (GGDEF)-like protein